MELQRRAVQSATRSNDGRNNNDHVDGDKDIPNYLRPSTGSCHHACKYGGAHAFQERDGTHSRSRATARPKPARKQQPAGQSDHQKTRARSSVPRKLFGGGEKKVDKAAADAAVKEEEKKKKKKKQQPAVNDDDVEWKDIVAYDQTTVVPVAPHGSGPPELLVGDDKQSEQQRTSRGKKKLLPNKHKAKINNPAAKQVVDGGKSRKESADKKLVTSVGSKTMMSSKQVSSTEPSRHRSVNTADIINSSVKKPPRGNTKLPTVLTANEKKAVAADREQLLVADGYHHQPLSPSLLQTRASLSDDLEHQEMLQVHHGEATANNNANPEFLKTTHSCLDHHQQQEEFAAAETEISSSRPIIPAHRRVKSMTMSSRSSVRFPFLARQASKNSAAAFKLRSKSSRSGPTTTAPFEEENKKPAARLVRSRRGSVGGADDVASIGGSRGSIQLRIRSLRRRGSSSSGSGFVVPAVLLRHQKTLEKKRSQRLYNTVIEETASKLVKTRKSRVKALVGAFESVISKIAK